MRLRNLIFGLLLVVCALGAKAQSAQDLKSVFSLASDTVVNTATITLTSTRVPVGGAVTIVVLATKISGTVGGTITFMGSMDGTNYKAINTLGTQTATATATATDVATNTYHIYLGSNPFPFYRVSWTGTGTMSSKFAAKLQAR